MDQKIFEIMIEDTKHWQSTNPPLCPNEQEIEIFKTYIGNKKPACLLGMTKQLLPFCDFCVDLNPINVGKPVIQTDWRNMNTPAEIMVGDGVLNLVGLEFIEKLKNLCNSFVCRVFLKKLEGMKYAEIFPTEFPESKNIIYTQENIAIVIYEFTQPLNAC